MALRPLKGRPGQFLDTSTGKVLNIAEFREDDKFDTNILPAGAVAAGTEFVFFRDVAQKRNIDTNFTQQSRLSAGEEIVIERVGATIALATGNLLPSPSDIKKIVENGFLRVEVNRLLLIEGPLVKFPSGYGLSGQTQETDQGIVSIGVPSTAAAAKLVKTQLMTSAHEVEGRLTYYDRNWTGANLAAGDRMPTLALPAFAKVWLHGLIKSAVSK
jgi:hypothetical protein